MIQKGLAKWLKGRYGTEMNSEDWFVVSSDSILLCQVNYKGHSVINDNENLAEEYCRHQRQIADRQRICGALRARSSNESCRCLRIPLACLIFTYCVGGNLQWEERTYICHIKTE